MKIILTSKNSKRTLSSCSNVDDMLNQTIQPGSAHVVIHFAAKQGTVPVKTLKDASDKFILIRDSGPYPSDSMKGSCGLVVHKGKKIAKISYNGRIWDMQNNEIAKAKANLPIGTFEI